MGILHDNHISSTILSCNIVSAIRFYVKYVSKKDVHRRTKFASVQNFSLYFYGLYFLFK